MSDQLIEAGAVPETENFPINELTPDQVIEFLPGWRHIEDPNRRLKSGGKGYLFSSSIGGKDWELEIDQSHGQVKLFSSAGDKFTTPRYSDLRRVRLDRRHG